MKHKKPYIARDTKEPLIVFGGYHVAEDGSLIRSVVPINSEKPKATPQDVDLLKEHGVEGLTEKQFHGVLDRLKTSGLI
jgi:hypothetical protein